MKLICFYFLIFIFWNIFAFLIKNQLKQLKTNLK